MNTWIALLRGINVGGHRKLPMKELRAELTKLGFASVKTLIQSGNAVFRSEQTDGDALAGRIADAVLASHGFRPLVLIRSLEALRSAVEKNPFPVDDARANTVHLAFLAEPVAADPDPDSIDAVRAETEKYLLTPEVFYLHAPDGLAKSKLAARAERLLGVPTTGRNLRTCVRILELAAGISDAT